MHRVLIPPLRNAQPIPVSTPLQVIVGSMQSRITPSSSCRGTVSRAHAPAEENPAERPARFCRLWKVRLQEPNNGCEDGKRDCVPKFVALPPSRSVHR